MAENKVCFVFQSSGIQTGLELSWNLQIRERGTPCAKQILIVHVLYASWQQHRCNLAMCRSPQHSSVLKL